MTNLNKQSYLRSSLAVACCFWIFCGCQSADSGGSFTGFSNPLSQGVPTQSEPPISTLAPKTAAESESTAENTDEESDLSER
jgi:hypothetical protein